MIAGAVFGAAGGLPVGPFFLNIKFIGTIFLNALRMVVIPLFVASVIVGVTTLGDIRKLGPTAVKTLVYYSATIGFAVLIGIILVNIIRPGVGVENIAAYLPDLVAQSKEQSLIDVVGRAGSVEYRRGRFQRPVAAAECLLTAVWRRADNNRREGTGGHRLF
jgi:Na+/H+-dicarboxylate symporter